MSADKRKRRRIRIYILASVILLISLLIAGYHFATHVTPPGISDMRSVRESVSEPSPGLSVIRNNWLRENQYGLWEMYIEGKPFERGVYAGKLTRSLMKIQEKAFMDQIWQMIPSGSYRHFLKYFIYWFNRNLDRNIPEEYKEEIYGISLSAPDSYSFIGEGYQRILNYHSAHDIGHALQEMQLVGCTSFGVWGKKSSDSSLIIGRNFDFYVGDAFAENKIVCFERPDKGHAFMMVTWGGMIGAVSGMNDQGLTVTINAAKSSIPWSARTPVSLLAREILQYASNIREAYAIAANRQTFVSESFLIGSAADRKAVVIEKSPFKTALRSPEKEYIVCTNHFQSAEFLKDPGNKKDMQESPSVYRYKKVIQDITDRSPMDVAGIADILRDRSGLNGKDLGMGNEKAINQLIAHHSIIFEPEKLRVWVSTNPWQLGKYVCYDLNKIFHSFAGIRENREIAEPGLSIPPDGFLKTSEYRDFIEFRNDRKQVQQSFHDGKINSDTRSRINQMIKDNPASYEPYELAGDYYRKIRPDSARYFYQIALGKEIPRKKEKDRIIKNLAGCIINLKKPNK